MISTARPFALGLSKGRRDYGHEASLIVLNVVDFVPFVVGLLLSTF
jgi:hypothetical protein